METKYIVSIAILIVLVWLYSKYRRRLSFTYIDEYKLHAGLVAKFKKSRPELSSEKVSTIALALKDYFKICLMAKKEFVAMPSQIVDELWHEFILFTRHYQKFCTRAFGRYLHHTPAEAMTQTNTASDGLKRAWRHACELEGINPKNPERLPRLFALDALYNIENGFFYEKDCKNSNNAGYCASDIGCSGSVGCGGSSDAFSSCGSSCGSGCGGD
jgi:hypothetical protein